MTSPPDELPPDQAAMLIRVIERVQRRQRIMIVGYGLALVVFLASLAGAFWLYGWLPEESFRAWVFLPPLGLVGAILWIFGYLAKKTTS